MAEVTAALVKELREKTGAGMMDCKAALSEAGGVLETAIEILRKKGLKNVGKRADKTAAEGCLGVYIHPGDQVGTIVELNCETDFVARGDEFKELAKSIAMHVAAMQPLYVRESDIPTEVIEKEKEIFTAQLSEPQRANVEKILPGKLKKFYEENCLIHQVFIKEESKTVLDLLNELSAKVGEKVEVRRFIRYKVGEGVEKSVSNLAADVAALTVNS
jgi:elongation factor Ts